MSKLDELIKSVPVLRSWESKTPIVFDGEKDCLTVAEFHKLMAEKAHPRDMTATCPQCGKIAFQKYDAEQIVPEPGTGDDDTAQLGAALQYTCAACQQTYSRSWVAGAWQEDDLLRVIDRRSL
jgi:hypothetical protein